MLIVCVVAPRRWTWPESFLFGAMMSATDPVAVVAVLQEVGGGGQGRVLGVVAGVVGGGLNAAVGSLSSSAADKTAFKSSDMRVASYSTPCFIACVAGTSPSPSRCLFFLCPFFNSLLPYR